MSGIPVSKPPVEDPVVRRTVYQILIGGMLASTALYAIATLVALARRTRLPIEGPSRTLLSWWAVVHGLATLDPATLMMLGTVVMILTPVARVVASIRAFAVEGDRRFVWITTIVLLVIVLTVVLGLAGFQ